MKTTRNQLTYFYGLAFALCMISVLLSGCQNPVQAPQTFNQRIAAGYALVDTVAESIPVLGNAGLLTPDDAQNALDQAKNLKTRLDVAKSLHSSQPGAAEDRLTAISKALDALNEYLSKKGTP